MEFYVEFIGVTWMYSWIRCFRFEYERTEMWESCWTGYQ